MNNAVKFARLDFITIKPYLTTRSLLILAALPLFFIVTSGSSAAIAIMVAMSMMYISYPFALGEKSNLDAFYATLNGDRENVVRGRYLFSFALMLAMAAATMLLSFVTLTILGRSFDFTQTLFTTGAAMVLFCLIQAVQLPIYFKLNYAKAKMLSALPFLLVGLFTLLMSSAIGQTLMTWLTAFASSLASSGILLTIVIALAACFAMIICSYALAVRFYQNRDF